MHIDKMRDMYEAIGRAVGKRLVLTNPWLMYPFEISVKPMIFCKYGIFRYYSLNAVIFKTF